MTLQIIYQGGRQMSVKKVSLLTENSIKWDDGFKYRRSCVGSLTRVTIGLLDAELWVKIRLL